MDGSRDSMVLSVMKVREICREGGRNVTAASSRLKALVWLAAFLGSGYSGIAANSWMERTQDVQFRRSSGWSTFLVTTEDDDIDVWSCERLADLPGVEVAGAIDRRGRGTQIYQLGNFEVPYVAISPSLAPEKVGSVLLVGSVLADRLEIGSNGPTPIEYSAGVWPTAKHTELDNFELGGAAVHTGLIRRKSAICAFRLSAGWVGQYETTVIASLDVSSPPTPVRQVAESGSFDIHPFDRFRTRPERFYPLLGGVFLTVAFLIVNRSRRSELAAYRLAGASRMDASLVLTAEAATLALIGIVVHLASALLVAQFVPLRLPTVAWGLAGMTLFLCLAGLAAVAASTQDVSRSLKDR